MTQWIIAFHFLRPWWLILLVIPLWWVFKSINTNTNKSSWEKVIDAKLLKYLLIKGSSKQRQLMTWMAIIGLVGAIIAAAGPSWEKQEVLALEAENPLMIALNMSSDMNKTDISPSRLSRAKFKIVDLLNSLKETQSGLMVYSSEPFVISPFSDDGQIIINLLAAVNFDIMPTNGDRIDRAIALSVEKFVAAEYIKGDILLIAADAGQGFDTALQNAKQAAAKGYKVNVLSINKEVNEKLKLIAEAGNGEYVLLSGDDSDVKKLAAIINKPSQNMNEGRNWQSIWLDYGYYMLVIPLFCCLYFFRKGVLGIAVLLSATNAYAGFFINDNQEGLIAFNNNDFATAEAKFNKPEWKGASLYRQGNFERAYQEFAKGNDIQSLYNQGNALAKSGKINEAIAKYEEVLKQDASHEDAKFNLEYLKRQQNQQQQNQQNQQQNQPQEQQQDNKQQNAGGGSSEQDNKQKPQEEQKPQSGSAEQNQEQNSDISEDKGQDQQGNSQQQPTPTGEEKVEEQKQSENTGGAMEKGEKDEKYDEKIQARAQQYREIPEDAGGLLRAFIRKEYELRRYNK